MTTLLTLAALLTGSTYASEPFDPPGTESPAPTDKVASMALNEAGSTYTASIPSPSTAATRPTRFYTTARYEAAFPVGSTSTAHLPSLSLGGEFGNGHAVGMRIIASPAWANLFTDSESFAIGPLVEYGRYFRVMPWMDLYPSVTGGFVVGKDTYGANTVLPHLAGGFGVRVRKELRSGDALWIMPETGFSVFSLAPTIGVSAGVLIGPRS